MHATDRSPLTVLADAAATLTTLAERVSELFLSKGAGPGLAADIRALDAELSTRLAKFGELDRASGLSVDRVELRAIAFMLAAAAQDVASAGRPPAHHPAPASPATAVTQARILSEVAGHIERALTRLDGDDFAAVDLEELCRHIRRLGDRGDAVYAEAMHAVPARRWRSVHGRLDRAIDRCAHAGRLIERFTETPAPTRGG